MTQARCSGGLAGLASCCIRGAASVRSHRIACYQVRRRRKGQQHFARPDHEIVDFTLRGRGNTPNIDVHLLILVTRHEARHCRPWDMFGESLEHGLLADI